MPSEGRIKLKIASPEKVIVDKEVRSVLIPATNGPLLVLPRRAPYISSLEVGVIEIRRFNDETQMLFAEAGMVEIKDNVCTVLTESAIEVSKDNTTDYAGQLVDYKKQLKDANTKSEKDLLNNRILYMEMLIKAVAKLQN